MSKLNLSKIAICDRCKKAFIPFVEGDATTCDECLAEEEEVNKDLDDELGV